jgi:hypothetical protein
MGVAGKRKFPSIIQAMIDAKGAIGENYVPTLHTDAGCILEALVAELDEDTILRALTNQGLEAKAYRSTLRALVEIARARRGERSGPRARTRQS